MQFFLQALMESKESCAQEDGERRDDDNHNDDEEALSLCDLPLTHHQSTQDSEEHTTARRIQEAQEDFDFDFDFDFNFSSLSQISPADEIFFQGQILPFRRCITSTNINTFPQHNSIPRSKSMNPYFSGRRRSSSHHSSTTSGSGRDPKQPPRNQFHSHPSPSPRITANNGRNRVNKPWSWNVFRLGLISAEPEIAFRDPKTRLSVKNSGGQSSSERKNSYKARGLVSGCNCSVEDTVPLEIAFMKRSASDGERPVNKPMNRRTYEWLKQLSLQGAAAAER